MWFVNYKSFQQNPVKIIYLKLIINKKNLSLSFMIFNIH